MTKAYLIAKKMIKDSVLASKGDSWLSPVIAGEERSSPQLTKTIKHDNQHLGRIKTELLVRLEAFKSRPKRKLSRQQNLQLEPGTRSN